MAKQVQYRGGNQSASELFIGAPREITVDTDLNTLRVHDGSTPGGHLLGKWDFGPQYKGTWNAAANIPDLLQPGAVAGDFYVVSEPGTTEINGYDNWNNGDRVIWSGTAWEQIRPQTLADSTTNTVVLNTNTAVFADGDPAQFAPSGKSGWFYENGQGKKINWYFYALNPNFNYTIDDFEGFYFVWEKLNTTSYCFINMYTMPKLAPGNAASWYRSRISFDARAEMEALPPGRYLVHRPGANVDAIEPTLTRFELPISDFTTVGPQDDDETIQTISIQTSSNHDAGHNRFIVNKLGYTIRGQRQDFDLVALPQAPPNYFNYYRGAYATAEDYPASAELGQWLINSTDNTTVVWDADGGSWVATGAGADAGAPAAASVDYPFQYTYSSLDGSGYGYANAYPTVEWSNSPDGKIQANTGTNGSGTVGTDILGRRVKFATLKNPGDEVTFQATDNSGAYNRYCIIGLEPGTDADALSWKVAGQPSSGTSWMLSDSDDRSKVVLYQAYIEPYWGGASYGFNLTGRSNSSGLAGISGNQGELPVTYRVGDDYRIEVYIDGNYFVKTNSVPSSGVELYLTIYSNTGRTFYQPTGNGANYISNGSAAATGARFFMSKVGFPEGSQEISSGGGNFLYSAQNPGDAADVELDANEANAARFARVFVNYGGMSVAERAESTLPVVECDEKVLSHVEYLARGYFHSLDLTVPEIQAKMAEFADALAAAVAGSVEVTLAILQGMLGSTTEPDLCQELIDVLTVHLLKFPR